VSRFSYNSAIKTCTTTYYAYPKFQNKSIKPLLNASTKFIVPTILLFFVDASEDLIMAKDATTSSNPFIVLVQDEELEKPPLDVNVSQWSHEEELIRRVVRTRVVQFVWDHRMLLNPHALAIYL
jgi:hypothetical protein